MLDQPIDKRTYFKNNHYNTVKWWMIGLGLLVAIPTCIADMNIRLGLFAFGCFLFFAIVTHIAGLIKYKKYLKTWNGHPPRK